MRRNPTLCLLVAVLLLAAACGQDDAPPRVPPHPGGLVGHYAAQPEHFHAEVVAAMRYGIREELEAGDAAAERLQRRLDEASAAWSTALANVLELRADGTLAWRLKEPLVASAVHGIRLVDLPPPSVPAVYGGTWRQTAPGEIEVEFTSRNGRALRYPAEGRCRVRPDGGLDISWFRDLEMSIEEAPLLRATR